MTLLSTHLIRDDGHDRLPFHPDCPRCVEQRLAGTLPADSLGSSRAQAVIAASALAFTSVMPSAAFAADPASEAEGSAGLIQVTDDTEVQTGLEGQAPADVQLTDDAPVPAAAAPAAPAPAEAAPPEPLPSEPADEALPDTPATNELGADPATDAPPSDPQTPPAAEAPPAAPPAPESEAPPTGAAAERAAKRIRRRSPTHHRTIHLTRPSRDGARNSGSATARDGADRSASGRGGAAGSGGPGTRGGVGGSGGPGTRGGAGGSGGPATRGSAGGSGGPTTRSGGSVEGGVGGASGGAVRGGAASPGIVTASVAVVPGSVPVAAAPDVRHPAAPGDASHVVERGESLWSIASDLLGGDASPAQVAREVNRLWTANEARIGTGDRDLLLTGTRLAL